MSTGAEQEGLKKESFANMLSKAGYSDFYVIGREDAKKLLTEKRLKLIETLREVDVSSKRELARELDRDIKQVSEDLDLLNQISIVEYREEGNRKIPELRHENIFIKPI